MIKNSLLTIGLLGAMVASAMGQVAENPVTLKPIKTMKLSKPVTIDTRKLVPQIAPLKPARNRISENEYVPAWSQGNTPNDYVAGGLMDAVRGTSPKVSFRGIDFSAGWPPDCDFAVGPTNVVAGVNTAIAFFSKTGVKQFQANLTGDDFFSGLGVTGEVISDPRVTFDRGSNRFFIQIIEVSFSGQTSHQLLAVSDTSNPNGTWKKYRIDSKITSGGNALWLDYPGVGVNKDGYVFTGNMFGFSGGFAAAIFTIPKAALLAGTAGPVTVFVDNDASTIMPARTYDTTEATMYGLSRYDRSRIKVHAFTGLATTPAVQSVFLTVPNFQPPSSDAVGPAGHTMDGFGDCRMFTAGYRGGSIVGAHNIGAPGGTIGSRWYEVRTNGWPSGSILPSLRQSGNLIQAGFDVHMPAISIDRNNSISVMATRNSTTLEAQLVHFSRRATDPLGQMGSPVVLTNSPAQSGPQPGSRWGDYFTVTTDPSDQSVFWGFGELAVAGGSWTTQVNSWKILVATDATPFNLVSAAKFQGTTASGLTSNITATDGRSYSVTSEFDRRLGDIAAITATYNYPAAIGPDDQVVLDLVATAPTTATLQLYALVPGGQYEILQSNPAPTTKSITLTPAQVQRYVSGGTITILVRSIRPARLKSAPYRLDVDRLSVSLIPAG